MMTDHALSSPTTRVKPFSFAQLATTAVIAAALNVVIFWIGTSAGASMTINTPGYQNIDWIMVAATTALPLLLAGSITWLIARWRAGFRRVAQWLGVAVALLSMASPFVVANDTATAFSLAAMHLIVAAAWFLGVRSTKTR